MVATVKQIEEWLRKLDETDLVSVYIDRKGKSYLKAYGNNGFSKGCSDLEMN